MSSDVEKLKAARALIAKPGGWIKRFYNRSADGEYLVEPSRATSFCAIGAVAQAHQINCLGKVESLRGLPEVMALRDIVGPVQCWNDDPLRTQEEVVAAFDRAIALAEQEAANAPV